MYRIFGVLLAIPLASCVTAAERDQADLAADDAYCRSLGVGPGSQPYIDCRLMVKNNRMRDAATRAQITRSSPIGNAIAIFTGN